jgi:hypothetical protein
MALGFITTFNDGFELIQRYQRGAAFRGYVKKHGVEILVAVLVLLVIALACTAATIVFVGGTRSWRVFLALIAAPLVLVGNASLLLYVFFSWVEGRAVTAPHPHGRLGAWVHAKLRVNLGAPPPMPWAPLGVFVGLPFLMLAWLSWPTALLLVVLTVGAVLLYARVDQAGAAREKPQVPGG